MSLFEDPRLDYYREWDRQYDEQKAKAEDARMLAYERKTTDDTPVNPKTPEDGALMFWYDNGEKALSAAKKAVKQIEIQ